VLLPCCSDDTPSSQKISDAELKILRRPWWCHGSLATPFSYFERGTKRSDVLRLVVDDACGIPRLKRQKRESKKADRLPGYRCRHRPEKDRGGHTGSFRSWSRLPHLKECTSYQLQWGSGRTERPACVSTCARNPPLGRWGFFACGSYSGLLHATPSWLLHLQSAAPVGRGQVNPLVHA
jgi:hypothetical protein